MRSLNYWSSLSLGLSIVLSGSAAIALPGQTTEEVAAWIQTHPTLRPASGETLLIRKSDTPARRFTFQASMSAPGRATPIGSSGIIRTEQISLFDMVNGVSQERLEESLRIIYGAYIFQDYQQATAVYQYPAPRSANAALPQNAGAMTSLRGEIREGDRFAYWVEVAQTPAGVAYTGQITVFLKEDISKLETELRSRR